MEDVVVHYKPVLDQDLPALIQTTEKLLAPFSRRPPQVFTPWFPSIVDRHLPLRPARPPPRILSAPGAGPTEDPEQEQDLVPDQDPEHGCGSRSRVWTGPTQRQDQSENASRGGKEHEPNSTKTFGADRGVPFVPETPPNPTTQEPGPQTQEPGLQIQESRLQTKEPGPQTQEPGLQIQESRLQTKEPGPQTHKPGLQIQKPGLQIQQTGLQIQKPGLQIQQTGLEIQEPGLHPQEPGLQVSEPDIQVRESGLQTQEPGLEIQEPGLHPQEPGLHQELCLEVQEPGVQTQEPGLEVQEPGVQIREPCLQVRESKPESPSKRCWTVFTRHVPTRAPRVQTVSRRFQQTVSKLRLQSRQRVKWIIDKSNCRDIEQVWRCLSRPGPAPALPSCCNAHIERSLAQVWVYCDLRQSEQVGLSLKHGLKLQGTISLWERRLGSFYHL